jgi:DpnII restriction endonuclease
MPKRPPTPIVGPPSLPPDVAIVHLRDLKVKIEQATAGGQLSESEAERLDYAVQATLRDALGENHDDIHRITSGGQLFFVPEWSPVQWAQHRSERLKQVAQLVGDLASHLERNLAAAPTGSPSVARPSAADYIERLLRRFYRVARQLRARHGERQTLEVNDEYDVQDLLAALLHLRFDDIRAEEWVPSYAGKASRMDFLLKSEQVVIETKMTRDGVWERGEWTEHCIPPE